MNHKLAAVMRVTTNFKPNPPRYYFKEWRKKRGFTQEELGEIVGMTASSLSQLENYKQGFSKETLEALANALSCTPGDLLSRDPNETETILDKWAELNTEQRKQVMRFLKSFDDGKAA